MSGKLTAGFTQVIRLVLLGAFFLTVFLAVYLVGRRVGFLPRASCSYPSYTYSKSGFTANEMVSTWVGLANGSTEGLPSVKSSGAGVVTFKVTAKASWPSGNVRIVAQGKNGFNAYFDWKSYINPNCSGVASNSGSGSGGSSGNASTQNQSQNTNFLIKISQNKYAPYDFFPVWLELSDKKIITLSNVQSNAQGEVNFSIPIQTTWPYGLITVVIHHKDGSEKVLRYNYDGSGVFYQGSARTCSINEISIKCHEIETDGTCREKRVCKDKIQSEEDKCKQAVNLNALPGPCP